MSTNRLTKSQQIVLKSLIDKEFGRSTSPADYYTDGPVENMVKERTKTPLSGSTLKRIVGLTNENRTISNNSLTALSEFLTFKSWQSLLRHLTFLERHQNTPYVVFSPPQFLQNHLIKIKFKEAQALTIRLINENKFIVLNSSRTLKKDDVLYVKQLQHGKCFMCYKVERMMDKKLMNMGAYTSGNSNSIKSMTLHP